MTSIQLAFTTLILWTAWAMTMNKASDGFGGFFTSFVAICTQFLMSFAAVLYVHFKGGRTEVHYPLAWWMYAIIAGACGVVALWTFTAALGKGDVVPVVVISGLYPVLVLIVTAAVDRQWPSPRIAFAALFMALAVILVFLENYQVTPLDN